MTKALLSTILISGFSAFVAYNSVTQNANQTLAPSSIPTIITTPAPQNATPIVVPEEQAITQAINNSLPSVVTISIKSDRMQNSSNSNSINIGSGFIISTDGLIVTNRHVVSDKTVDYQVLTNDHKVYPVKHIYRDTQNDISILKIDAQNLKPLLIASSDNLMLGQTIIAIGTPLGEFTNTVTTGIISGLNRDITAGSRFEGSVEKLTNIIQIDAAINPGNSGGPLLNLEGQVVGINTAVVSGGQDIGFAIPSNKIKEVILRYSSGQ